MKQKPSFSWLRKQGQLHENIGHSFKSVSKTKRENPFKFLFAPGERYAFVKSGESFESREGEISHGLLLTPRLRIIPAVRKRHYLTGNLNKSKLAGEKLVWRTLKEGNIPVPEFFTPVLRKKAKRFGEVIMEDLTKKYGKLYPINDANGKPVFVTNFSNTEPVVLDIAKDMAYIHHKGFYPEFADCWHFYKKKDNTWGRIMLDYGSIRQAKTETDVQCARMVQEIIIRFLSPENKGRFIGAYEAEAARLER
ncbi:MAG: hypothetical protein NTY48_02975 [Candidatus Diapherotrites archaeon]|nr:hypothetical protein [Candidatus Diapherotrites archaeon]